MSFADVSTNVLTPFIFAQFCQDLNDVVVSTATIINLYKDSAGTPYDISGVDFMKLFYSSNGNFSFNCDASGLQQLPWFHLSNTYGSEAGGATGGGVIFDTSFNVVGTVEGAWATDLNVPVECWEVCSKLRITEELLKANYICTMKCNICCSLCAFELAEAMNMEANNVPIAISVNSGSPYAPRTASAPVRTGDLVALSILFTNPNTGVNPVNLQLNFAISANTDGAK